MPIQTPPRWFFPMSRCFEVCSRITDHLASSSTTYLIWCIFVAVVLCICSAVQVQTVCFRYVKNRPFFTTTRITKYTLAHIYDSVLMVITQSYGFLDTFPKLSMLPSCNFYLFWYVPIKLSSTLKSVVFLANPNTPKNSSRNTRTLGMLGFRKVTSESV